MKKLAFVIVGVCLAAGLIMSVTVFFPKIDNFGINNTFVNNELADDAQSNSGKSDSSDETKETDNPGDDTPDNPDDPTPDNPDNPDEPDNPDNPDNPDEPDNPDNPDEPDNPDNPDNPDDNPDEPKPSDPDDPDEPDPVKNEYSFQILQNDNIVFDKESKGTIYSGKSGSNYLVYVFKISANYHFEVGYSDNVVITKYETNNFDKVFQFYISSGTKFCFVLDGNTYDFMCEEYKNFSYSIKLARGQNATAENNTVEFWDTNIIKLQVQVYVNGSLYDCEIVADREVTKSGYYMIFELEESCTINFHTSDNKFSFNINFVKTGK